MIRAVAFESDWPMKLESAPNVRALLTERELADEFADAFATRMLPEKFFYWFPLSVRAWLDLCSDGEYRNYVRSRSLIATSADELAGLIGPGPLDVVSLGAGQGDKDAILLQALARERLRYTPVDTSQALLELAVSEATKLGVPAEGVKADVTRLDHLEALRAMPDAPSRLVMLLGNTLGAFDAPAYAATLARFLREEDRLLLDGELYSGHETLVGYDNPINRRFAWAPLHALGIGEGDGDLRFETEEDATRPGLFAVTKHFLAGRDVEAAMGGRSMMLTRGERLSMSQSGKYAEGAFAGIVREAGLTTLWRGTSEDERFLMVLASPRGGYG